jgi:hypothetical protein
MIKKSFKLWICVMILQAGIVVANQDFAKPVETREYRSPFLCGGPTGSCPPPSGTFY